LIATLVIPAKAGIQALVKMALQVNFGPGLRRGDKRV
jgi:hypothetical protein